jgi:hypothetical protein
LNFKEIMRHMENLSPNSKFSEPLCDRKGHNNDPYGQGAEWSMWVYTNVRTSKKHSISSEWRTNKLTFTIAERIEYYQITLTIQADMHLTTQFSVPGTLVLRVVPQGANSSDTVVTATAHADVPGCFSTTKLGYLLICPVVWPHMALLGVSGCLCSPCCSAIYQTQSKAQADVSLLQLLDSTKLLSEDGPSVQVMSDHHSTPVPTRLAPVRTSFPTAQLVPGIAITQPTVPSYQPPSYQPNYPAF